jgi:transposase
VGYAGKQVNLALDDARYQKCPISKELATKLGISLEYIPPYSPDLNMIERFRKHVKGRPHTTPHTNYYEEFSVFRETIDHIVGCSAGKDKRAGTASLAARYGCLTILFR